MRPLHRDAIDDKLNGMSPLTAHGACSRRHARVPQRIDDTIDPDPGVAVASLTLEEALIGLLAGGFNRCQDQDVLPIREGQDLVDDLVAALGSNRNVALRAKRLTDPRPENPHVIIDFRDRSDGRSRRLARGALLDADGRRQAMDVVDPRRLQLAQELPRISAERLHVPPLPFGIDRVDGEAALAAAAGPAANRHLTAGYVNGDVLEVVLLRTDHTDHVLPVAVDFFASRGL